MTYQGEGSDFMASGFKLHDEKGAYYPTLLADRELAERTRDRLELDTGRQWVIEEQVPVDGPRAPGDHEEEEFH